MGELELLRSELLRCRECEELFGFEPRPISMGNSCAKIFQVSQAPSIHVHRSGRSFDDISGRKLRGKWYEISDETFYDPDIFYISSVGHCYPGKSKHQGDNPPPKICAQKWLKREIDVVDNEMFILIGKAAADFFFPREDFTDLVFSDHTINGKPSFVLPHPSPLNVKWFKDHPEFEKERIKDVRKEVHMMIDPLITE
ncbi:MAG: uracil-DNA glycosylase family protein [Methanomassiliicoccaceae archaeon]|nr:uracil-DNA glycosylase family protein [Methanomassiliicoccaceae archaeon]